MNSETFQLLAKYAIQARKVVGPISTQSMLSDKAYRDEMFRRTDAEGDEDLIVLSITLRSKLEPEADKVKSPVAPVAQKDAGDNEKYKFGARN